MAKIAFIGKERILRALTYFGTAVFQVTTPQEAEAKLQELVEDQEPSYGIVYIEEPLAEPLLDRIAQLNRPPLPVISIFPSIINGGLYLAQEAGLFAAEGLEIQFLTFKNTSQTVPLLASNQLEAAASGMSSALLSAVCQGARVRRTVQPGKRGVHASGFNRSPQGGRC